MRDRSTWRSVSRVVLGLVRASHFQPTIAVVAMATALAVLNHRSASGCLAVAAAVLAGQLSTGWSNDWFDAGRDRQVQRYDKPIVAGDVSLGTVRTAALCALVAVIPLSLLSGWRATLVHVVAIASAWSYNAGLKATLASPLPYALSFALLPAFVSLGPPTEAWPQGAIVLSAGLLGVGAHFINTLADRHDDEATGIRGLPQRMGATSALIVGVVLIAGCALAIWSLGDGSSAAQNVLLGGCLVIDGAVVTTTLRHQPRTAWSLTLASVVCCLALFAVIRPPLS